MRRGMTPGIRASIAAGPLSICMGRISGGSLRLIAERQYGRLIKELARTPPTESGTMNSRAKQGVPLVGTPSPYAQALADTGVSTQAASKNGRAVGVAFELQQRTNMREAVARRLVLPAATNLRVRSRIVLGSGTRRRVVWATARKQMPKANASGRHCYLSKLPQTRNGERPCNIHHRVPRVPGKSSGQGTRSSAARWVGGRDGRAVW